ncbi:Signal transduction histidine kinase [Chitinophaga costaii]|uniref:histidine kinase n=1 Tax=Chitinophaga costaii TaxID=1335309 RepID=A0A1C4DRG4_9BACT|nr:sensor histidine kinase [Chitinophaga costaii]PUZ27758.1 sensor histidine kinase [Chitinophaga costaii]SCC34004.1 Signal transduction histidine kinase [Chitinophaga costaii]
MTRSIYLLVLCLGIAFKIKAQLSLPLNETRYTDSLLSILRATTSDSTKSRVDYQLAEYWRGKDTVQARAYLDQGKRLAAPYPLPSALRDFYEGQFYFNSNPAKAAAAFLKAQEALTPFNTQEGNLFRSMSWFNYGIMVRNEKGDDFVIDTWLNKAIPLAEKAGNDEKIALYYTQLATLFMYNARFDKAEVYNNKALDLLESKHPNSPNLLFAYFAAISNSIYSKKPAKAKVYLDKAQQLLAPYPASVNYPNYYYNESLYYTTVNEFGKAMASLNKGIAMAKTLQQQQLLQMLVFRKYNILQESHQYAAARNLLTDILQEGTLTADVNNRKTVYQEMATVNASLGNMRAAYNWLVKYGQLSDSLQERKLQSNIQELEIKYHAAQNEQKIATLQAANEKAAQVAHYTRLLNLLLGIAAALLLVITAFGWLFYRNHKKLAAQTALNYQQQLRETEQQRQIQVGQALLQGEENERERVARDLHDGLGGMLASIKLNLSTLATEPALQKILLQLDHSSTELRRIAHNMMPESLLHYGLSIALKELCESLETDQLKISFQPFGIKEQLNKSTQLTIYRIVQETLSNALRHAQASSVVVQCSQNEDTFFITVEDNGRGFDKGQIVQSKGIGLTNIQKRVRFLNGRMDIEAAVNEGTTINIELDVAG